MIHPGAWLVWLLAGLVALSTTRNPWYVLLLLACILLVAAALRSQAKAPALPLSPWRFGLLIVAFSTLFNGLTSHFGQTVLIVLPEPWPLIGGPITVEALVYGAINGLVLAGFLAAFTVLTMALPTHTLIRLIPRAFYPIAVVISIAVAFVPTTLQQARQIREAQMVRGHRVRTMRDWLPLLMPLLVTGLERAFQLAEAMTARGFSSTAQVTGGRWQGNPNLQLALLALGLLAILAGVLMRLVGPQPLPATGALIAGAGLVIGALWLGGRRVQRTRYRSWPWTVRDWAVTAGALTVLAGYLLPWPGRMVLFYTPYPKLSMPPFDILLGLMTLGMLVPAVFWVSWPWHRQENARFP